MRIDKESTIQGVSDRANQRLETNSKKDNLTQRVFSSLSKLFTDRGEFDNTQGNRPRPKPLGPFPYLEYDSFETPFYNVIISARCDETFGSNHEYFVMIEIKEERDTEFKKLFLATQNSLEDPNGRPINNMRDLRKSEKLIGKILKYAYQHLPIPSPIEK